jgi:hypothetical protein
MKRRAFGGAIVAMAGACLLAWAPLDASQAPAAATAAPSPAEAAVPAAVPEKWRPGADLQRRFLREARVEGIRPIGKGTTGVRRVTLSDGTHTHDASFQTIDIRPPMMQERSAYGLPGAAGFVDSYKYSIAAYAIAEVVGLDYMVPVTIERRLEGANGALTWWVDDVLMDENEREAKKVQPPSPLGMHHQRQRQAVFGELIGDLDRNRGNMLYTKDWRLVMIDFTRGFRGHRGVRQPDGLQACDRVLYGRMLTLRRDEIVKAAGSWLMPWEIDAVMERREAIVGHLQRLMHERGEGVVLY